MDVITIFTLPLMHCTQKEWSLWRSTRQLCTAVTKSIWTDGDFFRYRLVSKSDYSAKILPWLQPLAHHHQLGGTVWHLFIYDAFQPKRKPKSHWRLSTKRVEVIVTVAVGFNFKEQIYFIASRLAKSSLNQASLLRLYKKMWRLLSPSIGEKRICRRHWETRWLDSPRP